MAIIIEWQDGVRTRAPNWRKLLMRVRSLQWTQYGDTEFRESMRQRAHLWNPEVRIITDGTARQFFESLAATGMFRITSREKEPDILLFPIKQENQTS